jgi:histidinol-phosphate/aromatic aminotransferase/cobyric acid decarboxylase-like protein
MFLGGAPLAMAYKAVNTLDSMVGYKKHFYQDFGWRAAIVDEAFIEFTGCGANRTMLALASRYPNLLVIRAATKFFGLPGLRLGYGITNNRRWREKIQRVTP